MKTITYTFHPADLTKLLADHFNEDVAKALVKFKISEERDFRGESMGRKVEEITLEVKE
jgi:hypothetical protein